MRYVMYLFSKPSVSSAIMVSVVFYYFCWKSLNIIPSVVMLDVGADYDLSMKWFKKSYLSDGHDGSDFNLIFLYLETK